MNRSVAAAPLSYLENFSQVREILQASGGSFCAFKALEARWARLAAEPWMLEPCRLWAQRKEVAAAAGKFKDRCLKTLDDVAKTKTPVIITKRGHPVAKLVPYVTSTGLRSLAGSILKEVGGPFSTGERWNADAS